nr:immunoglobulin light chain junction region [Macaca mulatta]
DYYCGSWDNIGNRYIF